MTIGEAAVLPTGCTVLLGTAAGVPIRVVAGCKAGDLEPSCGDSWLVVGAWETDRLLGRQFRATRTYLIHPTGRLLASFLAERLPVSGRLAERLYARLGGSLAKALDDADVATLAGALALSGTGQGVRLAARFVQAWRAAAAEAELRAWLDGNGFDGNQLATWALAALGQSARARIQANPYLLAAISAPWPKVDVFAWTVLPERRRGSLRYDRRRLVGAVDATVAALLRQGGTVFGEESLRAGVAGLLCIKPTSSAVDGAIRLAADDGAILPASSGAWRAPGAALLEDGVARRTVAMMSGEGAPNVTVPDTPVLEAMMDRGPHAVWTLDSRHRALAIRCLRVSPAVLAGPDGEGRSAVLQAVRLMWQGLGGTFLECAPSTSGPLAPTLGVPVRSCTLSEVIAAIERDPASADGPALGPRTMLAIDDASTVPLGSWHRLATGLPRGCRLLVAGDPGQLPPSGLGLVFHVLAREEGLAVTIPASAGEPRAGSLARARAEFAAGRIPGMMGFKGRAEGAYLEPCGRENLLDVVTEIAASLGGLGLGRPVQAIAPTVEGKSGARALNARFHLVHRAEHGPGLPMPDGTGTRGEHHWCPLPGEPVIILSDDPRRGLPANAMGHVESVVPEAGAIVTRFDGRLLAFGPGALPNLSQAWCLGGLLVQACRPERTVVALYDAEALDPSWLYTVAARTTRQIVFVGDPGALRAAMRRPAAWRARQVGFALPRGKPTQATHGDLPAG